MTPLPLFLDTMSCEKSPKDSAQALSCIGCFRFNISFAAQGHGAGGGIFVSGLILALSFEQHAQSGTARISDHLLAKKRVLFEKFEQAAKAVLF